MSSSEARVPRWIVALGPALPGLVLGVVVLHGASITTARFVTDPVGPAGFLAFIAVGLLMTAAVELITAFRTTEPQAKREASELVWWRVVVAVGAFACYITLLPIIGFAVATGLLSVGFALLVGERSLIALAGAAVGIPLLFMVTFGMLLTVELPGT